METGQDDERTTQNLDFWQIDSLPKKKRCFVKKYNLLSKILFLQVEKYILEGHTKIWSQKKENKMETFLADFENSFSRKSR